MEQAPIKRISLKQIVGSVEVNLTGDDVKSLLSDYLTILKTFNDNAELLKESSEKLSATARSLGSTTEVDASSELANMSMAEMVRKSAARKEIDKILLVSYYLVRGKNVNAFTRNELNEAIISEARLKRPANLSKTVGDLIAQGKLRDAGMKGNKKALTITKTGVDKAKGLLAGRKKLEE